MRRTAGILLSVSSLPSPYGIGCFDARARAFVDWLREAGQSFWQILPLGPTGYGDSPYQSFSTYAGNPYFISLEGLIEEGVLTREECDAACPGGEPGRVDYEALYQRRFRLLRQACRRSGLSRDPEFQSFLAENRRWLDSYALFMAIKDSRSGEPWTLWPEPLRLGQKEALERCREELSDSIGFQQYLQFQFFRQWRGLKDYANGRGVRIIGDIPIYAAPDSADVWAEPELFLLDGEGRPLAVAGCPPDGFSPDGQLWGNPLYRWQRHRETGYAWWTARLEHCFKMYDVTRIDHFRGFDSYFSIPREAQTAADGHWEQGPGLELFRRAEEVLGRHEVIAEDLGYVTDSVRRLVEESGFPGMKVLQFAFDARDTGSAADYLPHNYPENCVAYTGTHDNETLVGWFDSISPRERRMVREYLCDFRTPGAQLGPALTALIMRSRAKTCIVPLQDYLGLDNRGRMNRPSTPDGNWRWRLTGAELTPELARKVRALTGRYGRG